MRAISGGNDDRDCWSYHRAKCIASLSDWHSRLNATSVKSGTRTGTRRIASNIAALGSGQIVTWIISAVYLIIVSRYLGPTRLGELTLAVSIVSILGLVVAMGMETHITRTVARHAERGYRVAAAAIVSRAALLAPAAAVLYLYAHVAHLNAPTREAAFILAIAMALGAVTQALMAALRGEERMSLVAIASIVQNVLQLLLALIVIRLRGGVAAFAAISVLVSICMLVLSILWTRQSLVPQARVSREDIRNAVTGSFAFWSNSLFLTFYIYIDSIMLGALAGTHSVGVYAAANRTLSVCVFAPTILASATLPQLSRLAASSPRDLLRAARRTISLLIVCGLPITIGLVTFADPLIATLYGRSYGGSVAALRVLGLCLPFMFLNIQFATVLAACGRQRLWSIIMGASCIINPLFNVVLIPIGVAYWNNGAAGAALALLITEVMMACYGAAVLATVLANRLIVRTGLIVVLAGAAQLLVIWLVPGRWLILGEIVGASAYAIIVIGTGALPRAEIEVMLDVALRRQRPAAA